MMQWLPRALHRYAKREDGAITVEFVIIFPLILMLLFLIIFASMLIATASDVQQAAHELSRQSMRRFARSTPVVDVCTEMAADTTLMTWIHAQSVMLNPTKLSVAPCKGAPDANGFVTVTVSYNFAGSFVQAIGQNFGVNLGIITRTSTYKL